MAEPESKAAGFLSLIKALRQSLTQQELARLLQDLPPDTREQFERPPLPVAWLPARHIAQVIGTLMRTTYGGNQEKVAELATQVLLMDLKTIYKLFIKLLSPQYVIERGAKIYLTYTRNNGTLEAHAIDDHSCEVRFRGVVALFPGVWAYQRGAVRGALIATGLKQIETKQLRGSDTDGDCDLIARWG